MNNLSLGIDVSKGTFDVVLLGVGKRKARRFRNTEKGFKELVQWIEKKGATEALIGLESTGRYGLPLSKHLYAQGLKVHVINPVRTKHHGIALGARNKTDKYDAYVIADFCRMHEMRLWEPPRPEIEELQEMTRLLETYKVSKQREENRRKSGYVSEVAQESLTRICKFWEDEINWMKKRIQEHIQAHEDLRHAYELITSIKGFGPTTAPILLAEIQEVSRFERASQLAAYAGVTPRNHLSGDKAYKRPKMSKTGNKYLRKALYMPALVASTTNPIIEAQYQRLIEKGKTHKAALGAAMHKLLRIVYGVLKNDCPFDPNYGQSS